MSKKITKKDLEQAYDAGYEDGFEGNDQDFDAWCEDEFLGEEE